MQVGGRSAAVIPTADQHFLELEYATDHLLHFHCLALVRTQLQQPQLKQCYLCLFPVILTAMSESFTASQSPKL